MSLKILISNQDKVICVVFVHFGYNTFYNLMTIMSFVCQVSLTCLRDTVIYESMYLHVFSVMAAWGI